MRSLTSSSAGRVFLGRAAEVGTQGPPLRIVVALGGNAIVRAGDSGTIDQQFARTAQATRNLALLARDGHQLLVTHGNGPVVGNIVMRGEAARETVPPMPLYIAGADSEGGVGLMIQQSLHNHLVLLGVERDVVTVVTQTVVDPADPAFVDPDKPIGPYLSREDAEGLVRRTGWTVHEFPGRGWRRVVPSPQPLRIVEAGIAVRMAKAGALVIAAGGGGVPVSQDADGTLSGIDAVVDKDWAGALLACEMRADLFVILMESDALYRGWGGPRPQRIEELSASEAQELLASGEYERGTVAPKVAAAAWAASHCGCTAVLCGAEELPGGVAGSCGTRIVP